MDVATANLHPAGTYGRGLTPFFFAIALVVFGITAFLILRPVSARALASRAGDLTVALAGWLPAATCCALGGLVLFVVLDVFLGLDPTTRRGRCWAWWCWRRPRSRRSRTCSARGSAGWRAR